MKIYPPLCPNADGINRICDFDGKPCIFLIDTELINIDYIGAYCSKKELKY